MSGVLLALSVILGVCKSSVYNRYAKNARSGPAGILLFNVISYGAAALITLCFGLTGKPSAFTLIAAAGYAVIVFSLQVFSIAAMRIGPMSLTSLMIFYGMIIPSLAGPVLWREPFGVLQAGGMALMILSVFLLYKKEPAQAKGGVRWRLLTGFCFLFSGGAGVMEKVHQKSLWKGERTAFLAAAFLIMFTLSVCGLLIVRLARKEKREPVSRALLPGALTGLIIGFYNQINLYLSGALNSMVYYPIANGGGVLLTVLVSLTVFREKLTPKMLWGVGIGLLAILFLSL